jgi:filamin
LTQFQRIAILLSLADYTDVWLKYGKLYTYFPISQGLTKNITGGPGLERGVEGEPAEFNVWTREAGPGSLAISVEGPSKAQIDFKDRKDGSCYVSYIVEVQ